MQTPDVPKVVEPKRPIDPQEETNIPFRERGRRRGRNSLVSAGRLTTKATGRKSSLLGGQ